MKRVLLTGASGFVGANLARRLLADGHDVHLLLRKNFAPWRVAGIRDAVSMHVLDGNDSEALAKTVADIRPEWIFHLAAYGAYSSQKNLPEMTQTNFLDTARLFDACASHGFDAFVHAGSSSEYGLKDHAPEEDESLEPNSAYALTKAAATHYLRFRARETGLPVRVLRLYSVYGPFEEPTRFVPTLIRHGFEGTLPPLVSPETARDFVHADDVCEAFVRAAVSPGQEPGAVYTIGTGTQVTIAEAVAAARAAMRIEAEPAWGSMPPRSWDTSVWRAHPEKARRVLGWEAVRDFQAGLAETVEWYRAHPACLRGEWEK